MKTNVKFLNSAKGKVYYGMHFYPGVAQYDEPGKDPLVVMLNENTIREMGATFAGCPVYVHHVDGVEDDIDTVKGEVDGWVLESFFNEADGKHWVKFLVCSERGERAIRRGWRLSNAYVAKAYGPDGVWNGVTYQKEVTGGEFEHLAIVPDPRYEESVIMTPDEFKAHNTEQKDKLLKLANSKKTKKGDTEMKGLKFWERPKIKNDKDFNPEEIMVQLPKSKKEVSLADAIDTADQFHNMSGYAADDHMVKVGENEMSVKKLVKAHMAACNELDEMKKENAESEDGGEPGAGADDEDDDMENAEDETVDESIDDVGDRGGDKSENSEDEEEVEEDKAEKKKKNALEEKRKAKEKAARLKNARQNAREDEGEVARVELANDRVARGKQRYGSN